MSLTAQKPDLITSLVFSYSIKKIRTYKMVRQSFRIVFLSIIGKNIIYKPDKRFL